jgi:hypothetical protein
VKRRLVTALLIAAAVSCFSLGVGAWGYFSGEGSGSGSGRSGTTVPVTLAPAIADAGLYPGGSADVVLTASNDNTAEVRLISLALDTTRATDGFAVDSGHHGCGLAALSFTTQTHGGAGLDSSRRRNTRHHVARRRRHERDSSRRVPGGHVHRHVTAGT